MKRILALVLALALLCSLAACSKKETTTTDTVEPLTPVGTYTAGVDGFYDIQEALFDYFYPLLGFGHITRSSDRGVWDNDEIVQFAMIRLSYEGEDIYTEGVTRRQIERTTKRYFNQKAQNLDECKYLTYNSEKQTYTANGIGFQIGKYMVLHSLTVNEDGTCVAEFDRLDIPDELPEHRTEEEMRADLLNRWYEEIDSEPERITVTYRERDTEAYGYYIELLKLVPAE